MSRDRLARLERIEARLAEPPSPDQPLSRAELAELQALDLEYQRLFPVPIASMGDAVLDDLLAYHCDAAAARFLELQDRCPRTAEEVAKSQELVARLDTMTSEEINAWLADQAALPPWRIGR